MNNYLNDLFDLDGKVVVISGAGGHLCGEMVRGFARVGCLVAILDLKLKKAKDLENEMIVSGYKQVISLKIDVKAKEDHVRALEQVLDHFGQIDILINGAGINSPTPFFDISVNEWNSVLDSQVTGTFLGCQVFGKYMVERGTGSIINISSASAGPPLSKAFTYSVAKSGIVNLTKNLAREWATNGVRVNAIRPGFFPTEWNRKNFISKDRERAIIGHTPMARFGKPNELIGATLWLASNAAAFVTGAEITVDGGFSCMTI